MFEVVYERFGGGENFYVSTAKISVYAFFVSYFAAGAVFFNGRLATSIRTDKPNFA